MSTPSSSRAGLAALAVLAATALLGTAGAQEKAPDAPFVPTPMPVVERMLELAKVSKDDVVFDLGSGDGRMVIAAAQRYGARGVGVEINPVWVRYARRDAEQAGVTDRVTFRIEDLFAIDLRDAQLQGAKLRDVNLVDAHVEGANFAGADLAGARLSSADLSGATWTDGRVCAEGSVGECR